MGCTCEGCEVIRKVGPQLARPMGLVKMIQPPAFTPSAPPPNVARSLTREGRQKSAQIRTRHRQSVAFSFRDTRVA